MSQDTLFQSALDLLKPGPEAGEPFPLDWLSDISSAQARAFQTIWKVLAVNTRRDLIGRMEEEAIARFELDFTAIAKIAIADSDAEVRKHAIRTLWECKDPRLADALLEISRKDPEYLVRACSNEALGRFIEWAEFEEIPAETGHRVQRAMVTVVAGDDHMEVRRKAVESLGYSSDPSMRRLIEVAYRNPETRMQISSIVAMGHTADEYWADTVTTELQSDEPAMRRAAAKAAGEILIRKAVPALIEMLEDVDAGVRKHAVWALGEIGGEKARSGLERAVKRAQPDEEEWIDQALENLDFEESLGSKLPFFGLEDEDEDGDAEDG